MIMNQRHVKDLRDTLHNAISAFGMIHGLGPGDLNSGDCMVAIALVMRDIVQSAPDSATRAKLIRDACQTLMAEANRPTIIQKPRLVTSR